MSSRTWSLGYLWECISPFGILFISMVIILCGFLVIHSVDHQARITYAAAPVVIETKLGIESEYAGHKIVYTSLSHSYPQYDDINLLIDGKPLLLSPGANLGEVASWMPPRYAFFMPNGEKLILKEVSEDRSVLRWTNREWKW